MRRIVLWGCLAGAGLPALLSAEHKKAAVVAGEGTTLNLVLGNEGAVVATEAAPPKFWIGLSCEPIDETLRSQLSLEKTGGLAIHLVVEGGPAEAAGLKVHDVI